MVGGVDGGDVDGTACDMPVHGGMLSPMAFWHESRDICRDTIYGVRLVGVPHPFMDDRGHCRCGGGICVVVQRNLGGHHIWCPYRGRGI
ncbi:MAG: hypothetical protein RSC68_32730 [Acinetobacter sp.]